MKTTKDIMNMLDLFYANKHMYDKLKAQDRKREIKNENRKSRT